MSDAFAGDSPDTASAFAAALSVEWTDRPRFVVLDDRFDGGHRFLRCLQAWRADPHRCAQLQVITVSSDIAEGCIASTLTDEIGSTWPPITPNMHRLAFDHGQVQWLLVPMACSRTHSPMKSATPGRRSRPTCTGWPSTTDRCSGC